jgi:Arc/MetJ-type ribon-helix-helix transcriptional regulator
MADEPTMGTPINTRIFPRIRAKIEEAIAKHPAKYESFSHFVRVAVVRQLQQDGVDVQDE